MKLASHESGKSVGMLMRLASVCLVLVEMSAFGQGTLDDWADGMQRSRPEVPPTSRAYMGKSAKALSKANVDAFAEDRAIAESSLPFPLPDDARWSRLETPEAEYLSECTFSSPDGFTCRFAVYGQYGCKRAYYWTGVRAGTSADGVALTYDQGTNFVATALSRKGSPVDVRGVREILVSTDTEITVRGVAVDCPFDRFRFILADDRPGANWAHPCRFVFIAEDGRSFAVSYESWKPQIRRKTDGVRLWLLPGFHTGRQVDLDEVKNAVYSSVPNGTSPDAAFYAGDVSHSYFVLICGGATAEDNGIRFWADMAFMYSTLTKKYGVASDHIHVLMSDGLDPSADACLGETSEGEPVLVSSPTDLDGDGTVDVDRTASWNNLCAVFNGLKSSLTAQDQLVVFVTSHGNSRGTAGESNYDCRASLYSPTGDQYDEDRNYANFTDENLHNLTKDIKCPIAFAFETCFSGGFIDDLTATANRMVATACNHYEYSWGTGMTVSGPWTGTGIGKTRSHNRWARPFTSALRGCQPLNATTSTYPWLDGTACADAADANGDGKVCFSEAVDYAYANDAKVCTRTTHSSTLCKDYEHPQYGESSSGLGASFWLLKQNATPVSRPANDNFANATAISGTSGSLSASSANATKETGEPYHGISSATNSVWWKWTAATAGSMTITTEGSGFDTGLGVYTGSSVSALTKVVSNDDVVSGTYWSSVTFPVAVGTTYYIAVAGYNGATGSVKLNWSFADIAPSDFTYNIVAGSAVIKKYTGSSSTVVIPSAIDGYTVTALADYAFHQSTITSITLPDSLTKMGEFSLANCRNLTTIHLPANVAQFTSRQYAPFGGNTSQTAFTVASGNTHFTAVDGVLFTKDMKELISFPAGKNVERYDIPSSVTNIWGCAFDSCKYLTTVTIPEGVSTLMYCAFESSTKLASVSLPESLRTIGYYVFQGCSSLKSLTIPAGVTCMGLNALNTSSLTKLVLLGRSGAKYAGTFDYAAEKWGASIANSNIWVMPDDYEYWTAKLGEGLSVIGSEQPQTYDVIYNPGTYGSGAQQTATKTQGAALTLKGAIFTRTGYTQTGWSTSPAGTSKAYNLGAPYTTDAATTLYPYWTANTYSIAYALGTGGAHGTTHPTSATYGTAFYVSAPTRSGYTFAGWTVTSGLNTSTAKWGTSSSPSTTISSSSTKCANGATGNVYFKNLTPTANGSVTLTANWTAVIPLSTALDNTALTFTTGGDAGWFGQSANTHDGTDAARSGAITDNQNSWMQTTVTGPGTISFWWYASCEGSTYDYLSFSVDGVQTNKIGGTSCSWTQCSYTLGAGMHTMKWNYRKDGSVNSGLDAGFVDQVTWIPGAPVPTTYQVTFVKGTGVSAVYYRLSNSGSWTLYTAPFSVEKDAVVYYYVTPMSGYTVSCSSANPVHVTITGVATINVSADPIPKTLYVAADGSDAQSGDEGAPLATIQAAIDRAPDGSVVLVGPGVYAPISTEGKRIVIRGIDGPGLTVIDGGWTNRCAHLGSTTNTVLEGLTLRNGAAGYWSPYDGYVRFEEDGGGAYGGTLLNCHVVGNTARSGGGCANTVLRNCKVRGNAATRYGGGAYYSSSLRNCLAADGCCFFNNMVGVIEHNGLAAGSALYVDFASQVKVRNCIVAANVCDRYGDGGAVVAYYGTDGCALQNCTVVNNRGGMSGGDRAVGVSGFSLVNSIIRFNYDDAGRESDIPEFGSRLTISSCCVLALPRSGYTGSGNTTADPKFVDLERQVYRLQAGSPCLNSGSAVTDAGATDAMGRARIAENRIDMGACEGVASGAVVTSEVVGDGLVLEPGDVLAPNESIVFTAVETRRRFVNFTASNGAMTTDKVIRLSNVATDTTVVATFERVTFYVDATRPDDLGDGLSWGTAKKTIPAALALCARSDEVIVADGTYGAFTVPVEDVTVRSVNGPERTVIDAGGKRRCVDFSTPDGGEIVAALEGFTLCNGQTAYAGGGAYGGILKRCIVRDNVAGTAGGGLYGCRAENTIIVRNSSETFGGGAAYSTLVNCSVAGNRTNGEEGGGLYYGQAVNTVVWGNEANGMTDEYSGGSFTNCVTSPLPSGTGNRSNDPRLVDAVNGDVRLRTGSPLKDAGNPSFVAGALDVFGNARVQGSAVDVGAIEGGEVSGHVISVRVKGVGEVSPRTAVVSDGGSVTLMAVETSRPFSHYLLYGLKFSGREQTLTDLMSDLTVTAVFTPYTFYVDAAAKTSGDGLSWATAKRTIQEAVEVAATDETVRVAPGIYSPISTHNKRIVIESEKGPAVTVIDGGQTNRCATLADNSSGQATVLRGFTLTHGVLKGTDLYGGGAYAGTLDRCIVSNCQLLGTSSSSWGQGAGLAYSKAVNTLIVNNIASNYHSYAGTYYADLKNCTVTGNRAVDGSWQYGGTYYGTADNCIIWGNEGGDRNNSQGTTLKYCCVDSSSTSRGTGCVVADPQFVDAANGDYRLAIGSPCIGAGILGDVGVGEVDLDGLARIVNGTIDIGAYEWQNGVVIPRSSEGAVVIPLDWFSTGKIGGLSVFSPSHFAALFGTDYAIAAKKPTGKVDAHGNPMYVWQDFVAGTDPTDKTSEFKASISFVDGKLVITWTPDLNEGGAKSLRTYRTLGIDDLSQSADPAAWHEVTPGNESAYRFFKVEVDMK